MKKRHTRGESGMALVVVLLMVAIVTATVVEFAYGVYTKTVSLKNWQLSQRLSVGVKSGTDLAYRLISDNNSLFAYTYPGVVEMTQASPLDDLEGTITLRIEDENSKFNMNSLVYENRTLNKNAYDSFVRLLSALHLKTETADRIVDWIDPDSVPRIRDSEQDSKNGYLESVDELLLIPGIDEKAYETLLPYVTIYGGGLININGAEAPVLMSLADSITKEMAGNVAGWRKTTPFEKVQDILKPAGFESVGASLLGYITVKGAAFRVKVTASSGGMTRVAESVIELSGSSRTMKYWKEY